MTTISWQKIEGWIVFAAALAMAVHLRDMSLWLFAALALGLFMIVYMAGPRIGAPVYDAAHLYAFGAVFAAIGIFVESGLWLCAGLLFLAHAGIDRALGFGLKETTGFKYTHLGRLP